MKKTVDKDFSVSKKVVRLLPPIKMILHLVEVLI